MRRMAVVLSVILAVGLSAWRHGDQGVQAQQTADSEQVQAVNEAFYKAISAKDMPRLERLWSYAPYVHVIHPASTDVISGWDAVRHSWEEVFAHYEQITLAMREPQIRVGHNVAWIVGQEQFHGRRTGSDLVTFVSLATNVFEKQGDTWRLVHHHGSCPPAP
jgi:ketosteroid isomerase-like protein